MQASKTIHLTAFKPSGKYYSRYEIKADDVEVFQSGDETLMQAYSIREAVATAITLGQIPGGCVYVLDMQEHPGEVPAMFPIE